MFPPGLGRALGPIRTSVLAKARELAQRLPPLIPHPHPKCLRIERKAQWTWSLILFSCECVCVRACTRAQGPARKPSEPQVPVPEGAALTRDG